MTDKDFIVLLVGKSGSGKTTVSNILNDKCGWKPVESYTTRPRRSENETGHIFVTDDEFKEVAKDACAYTVFDGYQYCATNKQVDECQIYIIDPNGIEFFKKLYTGKKNVITIYLSLPWKERYQRMRKRGDSTRAALKRILHDKKEFKHMSNSHIVIYANDKPEAVAYKVEAAVKMMLNLEKLLDHFESERDSMHE